MAIGPHTTEKVITMGRFSKFQHDTKKALVKFFENPLHNLFIFMLSLTIVGLFLGMEFSWIYYFILFLLAILEVDKIIHPKKYDAGRKG